MNKQDFDNYKLFLDSTNQTKRIKNFLSENYDKLDVLNKDTAFMSSLSAEDKTIMTDILKKFNLAIKAFA